MDEQQNQDEQTPVLERYAYRLGTGVRDIAQFLDLSTSGLAGMLYRAADNFSKHGPREAAALSYYALLSLFPLLLLLVVGIGQILGPAATGDQIKDFLGLFLPGATATEMSRTIERFVEEGGSASVVAFITLAWSGVGLFSNLESALSRTFRDDNSRAFLKRRITGFAMILALGVLLLANILTSLLFSFLGLVFLNQSNLWLSLTSLFIPFGFSMGIFAMMYRWIPRTQIRWEAIWPAALLGGLAWEGAKRLFAYYLDNVTNYSLVYGSIATVIIFMLWAYLTCCIILFFGELCVSLSDWLQARKLRHYQEREITFAGDYYDRQLRLENSKPTIFNRPR